MLIEARYPYKKMGDEADELLGDHEKPSGIASGKGYNVKRVKNAIRRAEEVADRRDRKDKVTDKDMENMSATGVAQKLGKYSGRKSKVTGLRWIGKKLLKKRAKEQIGVRGHEQDIEDMEQQMKKDPGAFPPPIKLSKDSKNPHHKKETMLGGRTRQTIHRLVHGKPMDMLTLPSEKHSGSVDRHAKWVASGGREKVRSALAKKGKHLSGQDPRLAPKTTNVRRRPKNLLHRLFSRG
tara:strand:- start:631 stop:1341 length:711 start_codon:yes stop_codon:yes gene_type:complete